MSSIGCIRKVLTRIVLAADASKRMAKPMSARGTQ